MSDFIKVPIELIDTKLLDMDISQEGIKKTAFIKKASIIAYRESHEEGECYVYLTGGTNFFIAMDIKEFEKLL